MLPIILQVLNISNQKYLSYHNCSLTYSSFCHNISSIQEPKSFKEAIQHDCWKEVITSTKTYINDTIQKRFKNNHRYKMHDGNFVIKRHL